LTVNSTAAHPSIRVIRLRYCGLWEEAEVGRADDDELVIGGIKIRSRLITGSGKYRDDRI